MLESIATTRLPNGLKIICLRKNSAPVIAAQVWYQTGSVNEREGIRGISHLLEHMMFRGSRNVAPEEHAQRINCVGGHSNAFTTEDVTVYLDSVPRDHLGMVLELEADRMNNLVLNAQLLETERRVIIEEYHSYMNIPTAQAFLEFRKEFYRTHPYAISPLGILEDIHSVSATQCEEYYRAWYVPDNAVLVVVGDFESERQVFDLAYRHFGDIAASGRIGGPPLGSGMHLKPEPFRMNRRIEFDVPILLIGYPAPPAPSEAAVHLEILQLIVSQGESSRLHREIVRRRSLAVTAGGMNHCLKFSGMSLFFAVFTPDISARRLELEIDKQIEIVRNHGVEDEEMEKVKNSSLTSRTFELYSAEHVCQRIGFSEVIEGDYRQWVNRLKALEGLGGEQMVEAARTYWSESGKSTLVLQPKRVNPLLFAAGTVRRALALLGRS